MPQATNHTLSTVIINPSSDALLTIRTSNPTTEPNAEREFDNPLYEPSDVIGSSERPRSNSSEVYSFVGENGSYYESLQEGEQAI